MASKHAFMLIAVVLACIVQHANSTKGESRPTGRYIIRLKPTTTLSKSDVLSTFSTDVRSKNLNVTHEYSVLFQGFSVNVTDEVRNKLAKDDSLEIYEDTKVYISCLSPPPPPPPDVPSWGLDRIDQRSLPLDDVNPPEYQGDGNDVHIYIVDTGIRSTHVQFENRVQDDGFSAFDQNPNTDCNGHGTHVAGTAAGKDYGVAKKALLHSVKVLSCDGSGSASGVIAGLDWIAGQQALKPESSPALVASMSLGGGPNTLIDGAVESLIGSGVVVVVAAGNDDADACNQSPARATNAITVGASTISDQLASFSNYGSCVDIIAPGKDIKSAGYTNDQHIRSISGTSMACPHVSGAAAILLGLYPGWSPTEVAGGLDWLSTIGKVGGLDSDTPNKLLYIGDVELTGDPIERLEGRPGRPGAGSIRHLRR